MSKEYFSLPYCVTGHSIQGSTIGGKVIMFDGTSSFPDANWIYVALTRSRDFDNIYTVLGAPFKMSKAEINTKIRRYKSQDAKRNYTWKPDEYIEYEDVIALSKAQSHLCARCNQVMNFRIKPNDFINNWSIDRKNDAYPHLKTNCELTHLSCNVGHGNEPKES